VRVDVNLGLAIAADQSTRERHFPAGRADACDCGTDRTAAPDGVISPNHEGIRIL